MSWLNSFSEFFGNLTFTEGVLILLVILFYRATISSHNGRLEDRQKEIDLLAKTNREYRERFTRILDLEIKSRYDDEQPGISTSGVSKNK